MTDSVVIMARYSVWQALGIAVCRADRVQTARCTAVFQKGLTSRNRQKTGVRLGAQSAALALRCVRNGDTCTDGCKGG